ncbi:chromate transporter [Crenobacter intestini]|uniref:Chromate transporter n=1 Tax=Crenobacter intestini TaxID=2563443 RepID=A0A4T0US98_9NEIS|nr:chromate transporter [Crenobacter intestini]TIC81355.1 chromate transporter [Crenobacter intestini]
MADPQVLWTLAVFFGRLSLQAFGGVNVALGSMQRFFVVEQQWLGAAEFAELFALAQTAPGPNVIVVTLLGWRVAGLAGALVSTLAMLLPAALVVYLCACTLVRNRQQQVVKALLAALAPATVGLLLASGGILARSSNHGLSGWVLTLVTAVVALSCRAHPLWLIAGGGMAGWLVQYS